MKRGYRERWEMTSLPLTATANNSSFLPVFRSWLEQTKAEESSVSQETGVNTERGSYGNQETEIPVRKIFSQAHIYVHFLRRCWPHSIRQSSSPQPHRHRSLFPVSGVIILRRAVHPCLGLRASWKVENHMECFANSKSQCHKKQLQPFKSELSFMKQRRKETS